MLIGSSLEHQGICDLLAEVAVVWPPHEPTIAFGMLDPGMALP